MKPGARILTELQHSENLSRGQGGMHLEHDHSRDQPSQRWRMSCASHSAVKYRVCALSDASDREGKSEVELSAHQLTFELLPCHARRIQQPKVVFVGWAVLVVMKVFRARPFAKSALSRMFRCLVDDDIDCGCAREVELLLSLVLSNAIDLFNS